MKQFPRPISVVAFGLLLATQPIGLNWKALDLTTSLALAKGGEGNGGGGGHGGEGGGGRGGDQGGGGGRGGDHGGNGGHGGGNGGRGGEHGSAGHGSGGTSHAGGGRSSNSGSFVDALRDVFNPEPKGRSKVDHARQGSAPAHGAQRSAKGTSARAAESKTVTARSQVPADLKQAASLGRLNAGHASLQAMKNASANSAVGRIAAYRDAVTLDKDETLDEGAIKDAAAALAAASNKPVTEDTVRALNGLLGVEMTDEQVADVVAAVKDIKAPTQDARATPTAP